MLLLSPFLVVEFLSLLHDQMQASHHFNFDIVMWNLFDEFKLLKKPYRTRQLGLVDAIENPNKVIDFFSLVNIFDSQLKKQIRFNETVRSDHFLSGWLKQKGHPIIESRMWKDPNSTVTMVDYNGVTYSCEDCQLCYPTFIVMNSRIKYIEERRQQKGAPTYHLIDYKESVKDDFWLLTESGQIRLHPMVGAENRTNTYYYLSLNGTGVYRVFYRDENWKELLRHYTELPIAARARLMGDIAYFHKKGRLSWNYVWVALNRLKIEKSVRVWSAAEKMILNLERVFRFTAVEREFHELLVNITELFYNSTNPPNPIAIKLLCMAGYRRCLLEARNQTIELISNNGKAFYRIEDVFCAGIRAISREYFEHLITLVRRMDYKRRYKVMIAMTCYSEAEQLYGLLQQVFVTELLITPPIVKIMMLINTFLSGSKGSEVALYFMQNNYIVMREYFSPDQTKEILLVFAQYLKDRFMYRQAKTILILAEADYKEVLQMIQSNMMWVRKNDAHLRKFFKKQRKLRRIMW